MADGTAPVFKKRAKNAHIRRRPATPPPADSHSDSDSTADEQGVRIKRRRKEGVAVAGNGGNAPKRATDVSKSSAFAADRTTTIAAHDDATKASNWYEDAEPAHDDARAATAAPDGTYRGTAQYSTFIQKHPDARHVGPVKAPTNVRTITVTDFAPDVCKDYKQTGFCGFGDSCKFLHAREDYAQGWQLDREWEKAGKKKDAPGQKKNGEEEAAAGLGAEEKVLREIPFKCIICKDDYQNPVVTKCGHYFCEKCAMARYLKQKKKACANCGADTNGSFGVARKLKHLLEKKRQREEERAGQGAEEHEG